jgi:hypothetical protein
MAWCVVIEQRRKVVRVIYGRLNRKCTSDVHGTERSYVKCQDAAIKQGNWRIATRYPGGTFGSKVSNPFRDCRRKRKDSPQLVDVDLIFAIASRA